MLSAARGGLAALCFVPFLFSQASAAAAAPRTFWLAAAELTAYNCLFQGLLNVAVLDSDATRAAFLFQAAVVFTPAIAAARGREVAPATWAGAACAACGAALLAADGMTSGDVASAVGIGLSGGDAAALGAALAYSVYVYRLSELGAAGAASDLTQALKCVLQAGAYAAWAAADVALLQQSSIGGPELLSFTEAAQQLWPGVASGAAWAALAYSALVPGALADVLQARAQARVSAAEASVLLAAEPLWTALLGAACLGERMGARGWAGGALLLASLGLTSGAATDAAAAAIAALRTPRER